MKMPDTWYTWPLELTLSREAIANVKDALRYYINEDLYSLDEVGDELRNVANHIESWLEKHPISEVDELLL
jgi:hypothetical protein